MLDKEYTTAGDAVDNSIYNSINNKDSNIKDPIIDINDNAPDNSNTVNNINKKIPKINNNNVNNGL